MEERITANLVECPLADVVQDSMDRPARDVLLNHATMEGRNTAHEAASCGERELLSADVNMVGQVMTAV